ncbi:MAG: sensor histidine kinase [Polyangia bacterium]|jgi:signal transduction histidine kinase
MEIDGETQTGGAELEALRRRLEEAESSSRLKDRFLVKLAHDLKAPLAVLLLWEEVLRTRLDEPEVRDRALAAIRQGALSSAHIVDGLLDLTRAIEGRLNVERTLLELAPIVRAAIEAARPGAHARGLELDAEVAPSLGEVLGDRRRLEQAIGSLLRRAIKRSETGGKIVLRAEIVKGQARILVRDHGATLSPEALLHALDWFGSGDLGLALVGPLIELHGGVAESGEDGTVFTIALPLASGSQAVA